jgi:hypothetical protein
LDVNDILLSINRAQVTTMDEFRDLLASARTAKSVLLLIRRGAQMAYITLPF